MREEWRRSGGGMEEERRRRRRRSGGGGVEEGEWRRECMEENRGQVRGTEPVLYNPT